jgi:hypothetical protein
MVYYLQQHSTILSQISQQIDSIAASIAPQVSIPSTPSTPPFPSFNPSASDIRINAFWFMALTFSLSAALLAILVQQWVRDYMHVFQRYSDPQKFARMRQYLYEGLEGWYMHTVAEAVPGLLHVSLFLFFAGLADSTLDINTTIAVTITVPISICGLLYIFTTLAPVFYPQSPYQTPFSGIIWYTIQKVRGRRYKESGNSKSVSTNIAERKMELSAKKTMDRERRDKRAILWLLRNMTEDAEIKSFVKSMPGSLEAWTELTKLEVLPRVVTEPPSCLRTVTICKVLGFIPRQLGMPSGMLTASHTSNAMAHRRALHSVTHRSIATSTHEKPAIQNFCMRIGRYFDTCKNPDFERNELWKKHSRACIEAMASLVSFADVKFDWFGDTLQSLEEIRSIEKTLDKWEEAFVVRWTCLSIMAIRSTPKGNSAPGISFPTYDVEMAQAVVFDDAFENRWREQERGLSSKIAMRRTFNAAILSNNSTMEFGEARYRMTLQLPGVDLDFPEADPELFLRQTRDLFSDPAKLRFMSCRQPLNKFFEYLKRVNATRVNDSSPNSDDELTEIAKKVYWPQRLLQRKLWSLEDLRDGGLGFAVELFLLSVNQLLSTQESHLTKYAALYIGTFKAITSDRSSYKISTGTQNILLDAVASDQGFLRRYNYPNYITDEVWELLGDILEGPKSSIMMLHINDVKRRLRDLQYEDDGKYWPNAKVVISRLPASSTQ